MAEEQQAQEDCLHNNHRQDTRTDIGSSALIFPKSVVTVSSANQVLLPVSSANQVLLPVSSANQVLLPVSSANQVLLPVSSANQILLPVSSAEAVLFPQQFENVAGLDGSDPVSELAMGDLVGSSASVSQFSDAADNLSGLTLVGSGGGEFMIVSSETELDGSDVILQNGATITLSLDEATRFLLQQRQDLTETVELVDGTFQIVNKPVVKVEKGSSLLDTQTLHIEVLEALHGGGGGGLTQQLPIIHPSYSIGEEEMRALDDIETSSPIKTEIKASIGQESDLRRRAAIEVVSNAGICLVDAAGNVGDTDLGSTSSGSEQGMSAKLQLKEEKKMVSVKKEHKQPDLNCPIPLSDQTVITVKGKKCVLAFNQETQQVCAYPIKQPPGTKRRGRPRMTEEEKSAAAERKKLHQVSDVAPGGTTVQVSPSEKSTAAETLLELSNIGSDGVRRSARKRRKVKLFEEYEELEDSGDDEDVGFDDNQEKDPDINLNIPEVKKKKIAQVKKETDVLAPAVILTSGQSVKRGRGRPRRYPPSGQTQTASIPAIVIPSSSGQTLVMTDIQGLQNLHNFQRHLPNLVPKPAVDPSSVTLAVVATTSADSNGALSLGSDSDALPLDTSSVVDSNSIIPPALQGDTILLDGDTAADSSDHGDGLDQTSSSLLNFMTSTTTATPTATDKLKDLSAMDATEPNIQSAVIQIPGNVLASLGFRKDPVKIGLKASEQELEKLKCSKCDFQGYYVQQYRNHIAMHGEDIQKCKCCNYLSLDGVELLDHFKEYHPRCICTECGYMAEHAYIIKRHMMRHDTKSCTCNLCGKVYKDMYILKMHIKMVHMPAEVLFECNVCSKKFTRKAHLKRHLRIHEPEKPYKCPVCDYRGCERSDISKHMLIHEEPKHTCERCGKTFRHVKNKELHVKRHYGQRDYKCGVCDFFGYTFTDIRKHIERKHQDIKTLICDKCSKHFRNDSALKEHQQTCTMMIEQVLAIPTSSGGTSQATIQIPTNLGPDTQLILDGQSISISNHTRVSILTDDDERQLNLAEGMTEEEEEEEEDDMDDEEGDVDQSMSIMKSDPGQSLHIIAHGSLGGPRNCSSRLQGNLRGEQVEGRDLMAVPGSLHVEVTGMMEDHGSLQGEITEPVLDQIGEDTKEIAGLADECGELAHNFVDQQEQT